MSYGARNPEGAHRGTMLNVRSRPDLSVIDVMTEDGAQQFHWSWPVCVPSDGAFDVPLTASMEKPVEPVTELGSRGFPILYGLVPEKPLVANTNYVATFEWQTGAGVIHRVLRFRTQ